MMTQGSTLGTRFVNAYNTLDHCLRTQYNFKTNISFSDLIRRCSSLNQVIRAYEDDLIDFARLRNAIIHNNSEQIIAEPHEDVVELIEKVARIISTPPLAIEAIKSHNVHIIKAEGSLRDLILETTRVGHNNIPVYKGGMLVGVIRWRKFIEALGNSIQQGKSIDQFVANVTIEQFLREYSSNEHFAISSARISIEEVLNLFNRNRKLSAIIVTEGGTANERPIGIITGADVMDLMKVLGDF